MGRLFAPKPKAPEAPAAPPPPAAPASLTKDEVKELVTGAVAGVAGQMTEVVNRLGARVEELAGRQPQVIVQQQPHQAPREEDISDQEIDSAVLSGQGAAARIRALVDKSVNAAAARIVNEHVKPLQDYGVNTIGELSRRITVGGMKHYNRFKKEIDERMNALTPDVRANPLVAETIYNAVVGMHAEELQREAAEAAVRQAQEGTTEPPPAPAPRKGTGATSPGTAAGAGGTRPGEELPDFDTYLGSDATAAREALQHKGNGGQDQDALARSMGYKDWAAYMKQYQELLAAESAGNA